MTDSFFLRSSGFIILFLFSLFWTIGSGCSDKDHLFERRSPLYTGVQFQNTITEDDTLMNPVDYRYLYNGGGVGIGDFNNDGRPDLYFTGNMVENRLYLNQGNFQFREVTAKAGVAAEGYWSTGVAVVDVNQDGLLDLYVCVGGPPSAGTDRANRLYVNQGIGENGVPSFKEQAEVYGIADSSYSTQAAFFDYDRDGDLDLYVLNNAMQGGNQNAFDRKQTEGQAENTDRLYQNNGDGTFTNVSEEAGIQIEGYGLGVAISDVNKDGWPDIYVANDFAPNDLLYVNNGDATFTNRIGEYLKHQSYSSMGVDIADVNNDSWNDILVLDMLPPDNYRRKMMPAPTSYEILQRAKRFGYEPQYLQNTLQLNNGIGPNGSLTFSDVSRLAGVAATDWSWSPLLADYDNDGDRDLFVTNGYGEDVTNFDFLQKQRRLLSFGTEKAKRESLIDAMKELPKVKLPNRLFENEGELDFTDRTGTWARRRPGISNGAAFGDLDNDGDLDLVTNNINEVATLLENQVSEQGRAHSVRVNLHGPPGNRRGLGARLTLYNEGVSQYSDHSPYRGYQATVESVAHFGVGTDTTADSLRVVWPDGKTQLRRNVATEEELSLHYEAATFPDKTVSLTETSPLERERDSFLFREVAADRGLAYTHEERAVNEFERTPILPHKLSKEGPGLAVGDVDGNGLDDVYVGADRGHRPVVFRQVEPGRFQRDTLRMGKRYEDRGALFFDAEGDGDLDLYVVSGGPVRSADSTVYQDRLYLNDGTGSFRRTKEALPEIRAGGSVVAAADYDRDGDLDLFVGGRTRPGEYPLPPRSYLLRNDSKNGSVRFTDVTKQVAPELAEPGLVTDALWTDYDDNGQIDLMVVGEWMPITVLKNEIVESGTRRFTEVTKEVGLGDTSGWWLSLAAGDFDRDGDTDYVAGNLGQNTRYEASPRKPVRVHAKDYDRNGQIDPVLAKYMGGRSVPIPRLDEMTAQIPGLKSRFPSYSSYAKATFAGVFTEEERKGAYVGEAVRFETSYVENEADGTFSVRALPVLAQTAPVFGMKAGNFDDDSHLDLLMVGNWYATDSRSSRADAFVGALLKGDGTGRFTYESYSKSGFLVKGDGKGLAQIETGGDSSLLIATQSDGPLQAFQLQRSSGRRHVEIRPEDRYAELTFEDGSTRKVEFYYGSTYLSQSSRTLIIPDKVTEMMIYSVNGSTRAVVE